MTEPEPKYLPLPGFGRWALAKPLAVVEGWPLPEGVPAGWWLGGVPDVDALVSILRAVLDAATFVPHPGWFQGAFEPVLAAGDETVCAPNHAAGPLSPAVVLAGGLAQAILMPYRVDDEEDEEALDLVDGRGTPRKKA